MYCQACRYNLTGLGVGSCPECARPFDPADPASFDVRPRPSVRRLLVGLAVGGVCAMIVGAAAVFAFRAALRANYGFVPEAAFDAIFRVGLIAAFATALLAALNRSWPAWIPLLTVGIACYWASLVLGTERYYRVWQSIPNPPVEAYADSGVLFTVVLGWIPGVIVELVLFGLCMLVCRVIPALVRRKEVPA